MNVMEFYGPANEKPLDRLVSNCGFCGIFRSIGCIGDSLASGEFEFEDENGVKHYYDSYEYSWGQYIARMVGTKVYNFSRGGMTAKEYCTSFAAENDFYNPDLACGAYIIALGVNDIINMNMPIGTVDDINLENCEDHPDTFAGWYSEIVLKYKKISPECKFFLVSLPRDTTNERKMQLEDGIRNLLVNMTKLISDTYIIDLWEYGPVYDEEFKEQFYLLGHMNPMGYMFTATMFISYIDYIIRHNPEEFKMVGFIPAQRTFEL